tara:strand:- start:7172 stop:8005 length:834 start_codon:yes stop_codon:yes gene_type:complete
MIISKVIGGLGNQMFQYAIAHSIALENSVDFKLDISEFETYELFSYRLNEFNISGDISSEQDIKAVVGKNTFLRGILKRLGLGNHFIERERTIYDSSVFKKGNLYLEGYWQNELYFSKYRKSILKAFTPKCSFSGQTIRYGEKIKSTKSVSVHIRRGDYLKHDEIGVLPLSYYQKAIIFLQSKEPNSIFYFFSNDIAWCKESFKDIDNTVFIDDTESEIADLWLMSQCESNIIANSSFSWWGAWLNQNPNKVIISPTRWMIDNPKNHKWVPDEWLQF